MSGGTNFAVFAKYSLGAQLLLFNHVDDTEPARTTLISIPTENRTLPLLARVSCRASRLGRSMPTG